MAHALKHIFCALQVLPGLLPRFRVFCVCIMPTVRLILCRGGRATLFARSDAAVQVVKDVGASVGATGGEIRLVNCSAFTMRSIWTSTEKLLSR